MTKELNFYQKLSSIQTKLKAPKNQYNKFGKYNYRSCEDILEGVKPHLDKNGLILTVSDNIVMVGDRYYVQAIATITDGDKSVSNTAFAREELTKKGMDSSQITCSTSSYARKYALNGLFCIDDTKDADASNNHDKAQKEEKPQYVIDAKEIVAKIRSCADKQSVNKVLLDNNNKLMAIKESNEKTYDYVLNEANKRSGDFNDTIEETS